MQKLRENTNAMVDLSVVLMIGIAFAALMVIGYIIWKVKDQLAFGGSSTNAAARQWDNFSANITIGFDNSVNLILVAITIFILAVAISALLMLRGGNQ
jgi:large-conductance mechanosensitive channel